MIYPEYLPKEDYYIYKSAENFINPLDLIHAFTMQNYSIGMHIQDFWEINIIIQGKGMHYFESNKLTVKRGDVFIIPPNTSHGYASEQGFDVFHLLINNRFIEKYLSDLQLLNSFFILFTAEPLMRSNGSEPLHLTLTGAQFNQLRSLLQILQKYSAPQLPSDSIACNSLAMILITELCEMYSENANSTNNLPTPNDTAFMNALTMIHEHYDEKISIAQLAKTAHLSRSSFIRKFQEICKTSPARYLTQKRIEVAKHLLVNTTLSLSEIAEQTGFYDTSHLTKTFIAETGYTPTAYKKCVLRTCLST